MQLKVEFINSISGEHITVGLGDIITCTNVDSYDSQYSQDNPSTFEWPTGARVRLSAEINGYMTYISDVITMDEDKAIECSVEPHVVSFTIKVLDGEDEHVIPDAVSRVRTLPDKTVLTPHEGVYDLPVGVEQSEIDFLILKEGYTRMNLQTTITTDGQEYVIGIPRQTYEYKTMTVTTLDAEGEVTTDPEISLYDRALDFEVQPESRGVYYLPINNSEWYQLTVRYNADVVYNTTIYGGSIPDTLTVDMPQPQFLVAAKDATTDEYLDPSDWEAEFYDLTTQTVLFADIFGGEGHEGWYADVPYGHDCMVTVTAEGYTTYTEEVYGISENYETTAILSKANAILTVSVTDGTESLPATVNVYDQTDKEPIIYDDEIQGWNIPIGHEYDITAECEGYYSQTTPTETVESDDPIHRTIILTKKPSAFATVSEYEQQTGKTLSTEERKRVEDLLLDVSDIIREEGRKYKFDVDAEVADRRSYANLVKVITIDVTDRVMRQGDGVPMAQESQSALGYSWSGTYAVAGGGVALSLMNNEIKRLGFKVQQIGDIQLWGKIDDD